ncbi:hypothetical protein Q31b_30010 [Novipirellula aureliae]|uniref:Uncharacterized protein n=1 Tax=Novipirellula aureliae TaxID=2527966 RepID=A0A5C6DY59_9BACT|nr:hypothetical protein [Novipirellula aureliae]TWU41552.1 hypothetical protein Q31b_30010 [Novipirellula aureliae]
MNRWLMIGSIVSLMVCSTGCLHHNLRSSGCQDCTSSCGSGSCSSGQCGKGILGRLSQNNGGDCGCQSGACGDCQDGSCGGCRIGGCLGGCGRNGCVAGPLGWQQGGLDYSSHLNPGLCGHGAGAKLQNQPFTPGPSSAQVGYPYYTHHGPRDFLMDNPPTIGR